MLRYRKVERSKKSFYIREILLGTDLSILVVAEYDLDLDVKGFGELISFLSKYMKIIVSFLSTTINLCSWKFSFCFEIT